jgi:hypothetical protein
MPASTRLANRTGAHRWAGVAAALALAAIGLLVVRSWKIDYPYSIDFQVYWLAGVRIAAGNAASLYEPGGGPAEGTPRAMAAHEFKNIPVVALAFAPFARLDYARAKRWFWWTGLGALLLSGVLLGRFVLPPSAGAPGTRVAWSLALICSLAPAHTALRHGQTTPLVLLALTGYLAAALRGRPWLAGACLALASVVKLPVLALGGVDALRARLRQVAAWLLGLAALVGASIELFGPGLHRQYLAGLEEQAGSVMTGHNNQSIAAALTRLAGPAPVNDWQPRPLAPGVEAASLVLSAVLAALLVGAVLRARGRSGSATRRLLEFPAALALGLVVLPVAWDHYFLLLAPGLAALAVGLGRRGLLVHPAVAATLGFAFVALAVPTPGWLLERGPAAGLPGAVLLSHYFLGALVVFALAVAGLLTREPRGDPIGP